MDEIGWLRSNYDESRLHFLQGQDIIDYAHHSLRGNLGNFEMFKNIVIVGIRFVATVSFTATQAQKWLHRVLHNA